MKFTSKPKTFDLITIGNVSFSFSFSKRKGKLWVGEMNIIHNTKVDIDKETEKALHKEMKRDKTDLLTDGTAFFTTTGESITEISHSSFRALLDAEENT